MRNPTATAISVSMSASLTLLALNQHGSIVLNEWLKMFLTSCVGVYALLPFTAVLGMLFVLHHDHKIHDLPPFRNLNLVVAFCNTSLYILAGLPMIALIYGGSYVAYAALYDKVKGSA